MSTEPHMESAFVALSCLHDIHAGQPGLDDLLIPPSWSQSHSNGKIRRLRKLSDSPGECSIKLRKTFRLLRNGRIG